MNTIENEIGRFEMEPKVAYFMLGEAATGSIEARDYQQERLEEFTQDVGSGNFHVQTEHTIPSGCVDGRCGCTIKPNSAGGSESLMVADDLTNKNLAGDNKTTLEAYRNVLNRLKKLGLPIGGHTDTHAHGDASGCGANDKLPAVYQTIATSGDALRQVAEAIGIEVSDTLHEKITGNAVGRTEFSTGRELLELLQKYGSEDHPTVDTLEGEHNEVLAVINLRKGTTLDRDAVHEKYGEKYMAFNFDAWSFGDAANVISTTENGPESQEKAVAIAYYNLAVALVLCGPNMRVVVLS